MIIFKKIDELQKLVRTEKENKKSIGFFPTMGALHEGHLSLLTKAKKESDITVCSIFVNPTQFNDTADFEKYPITIEHDIYLLESHGCDILFLPDVHEMYPHGQQLETPYHLGTIEHLLEGKFRPGHFQGVCQVVNRLLDIVQPDKLFMGQKDYQQIMVIRKMLEEKQIPVQLVIVPTFRAGNGLALSSRNARLDDNEKEQALVLSKTLQHIKDRIKEDKDYRQLEAEAKAAILHNGFSKVDYVEICHADTLKQALPSTTDMPLIALVAAYINGVRLIDNLLL